MLVLAEGVSRAMEKIWWKRREGDEVEGEKSLVVRCEHGKRKCCRRWKRRMKWECAHSEVVEARKRRVVVLVAVVVVVRVSCGKVVEIMSQLWVCVWQHVRRFVVVLQEHEDGEKDNKRRKPNVWCSPILSLSRCQSPHPSEAHVSWHWLDCQRVLLSPRVRWTRWLLGVTGSTTAWRASGSGVSGRGRRGTG